MGHTQRRVRTVLSLAFCWALVLSSQANQPPEHLSIDAVEALLKSKDASVAFVDARSTDAYLGWALDGISRGGHLPGAIHFASAWLTQAEPSQLKAKLRDKGLTADRQIVIYDTLDGPRQDLAKWLGELGFQKLAVFDLNDWADDPDKALVSYPNHSRLVPPVIAKAILEGKRPPTFEAAKTIKFAEVSWGQADVSYDKGHIPSSFHIDTNAIEPPPLWKLASPEALKDFALAHGLTHEDTVILSGRDPMAAFRVAVVLRYMGVRDVRVLHGGDAAWLAAGYALERTTHLPSPVAAFGCPIPARPELIDHESELKRRLGKDPQFTLVDIRTWKEYRGEVSGYSDAKKKGRLPHAIYGRAGTTGPNSLEHYRNLDQTMRSPAELQQQWQELGIDPNNHLSFMCGGGWRAAEVLTYAQVMGFMNSSLYSDGWLGWSRDPANPIVQGQP